RALPRGSEALAGIWFSGKKSHYLSGQLSWSGLKTWIADRRQLRQLSWRAQYSALEQPALHDQSRQPGEDLWTVPSGSHREICAQVPRRLVSHTTGNWRESSRSDPSNRRRGIDRHWRLSPDVCCSDARRPALASGFSAGAEGCDRCLGHDALLPRPALREARV